MKEQREAGELQMKNFKHRRLFALKVGFEGHL